MNENPLRLTSVLLAGALFVLSPDPVQAQESPTKIACSDFLVPAEHLNCLYQAILQMPENKIDAAIYLNYLMPQTLLFLSREPNRVEPPLPWLKQLSSGKLLKAYLVALAQPQETSIYQHLLRLFQYVLIMDPKRLEPALQQELLKQARTLSQSQDPLTRLLAIDLLLLKRQPEDSSLFKRLLQSESTANEKALLLLHYQKWQKEPALAKLLPAIPAQSFLSWAQSEDALSPELKTWTFHKLFQDNFADFQDFLAGWLESSVADTIKLSENSLKNLLQNPTIGLRQYAIKRLALTGNPAYIEVLQPTLNDPDAAVQTTARKALEDLQKLKPLYYLDSLKDPLKLPVDSDQRLQFLFEHTQQFTALFEPVYRHLHARPEFKRLLWQSLHNGTSADLQLPALKLVSETYPITDVSLLEPLLARSQDVRVRSAALQVLLKQPYQPAGVQLLQALIQDPQIELSLAILHDLFQKSMLKDSRTLLNLMAKRSAQKIDRGLIGFESKTGSSSVEAWIAERLPSWLKIIKSSEDLRETLIWIQDESVPLSWRRAAIKQIGQMAQDQVALSLLQKLAQNPQLELDAELAIQAIQDRLD